MASQGERVLAAEWTVMVLVITGDAIGNGGTPPAPSQYVATVVVYAMLAALSMFGSKASRLAGAFGGVAAIAILLAPGKGQSKPLVVRFFNWVTALMGGAFGGGAISGAGAGSGSSAPVGAGTQKGVSAGAAALAPPVGAAVQKTINAGAQILKGSS